MLPLSELVVLLEVDPLYAVICFNAIARRGNWATLVPAPDNSRQLRGLARLLQNPFLSEDARRVVGKVVYIYGLTATKPQTA